MTSYIVFFVIFLLLLYSLTLNSLFILIILYAILGLITGFLSSNTKYAHFIGVCMLIGWIGIPIMFFLIKYTIKSFDIQTYRNHISCLAMLYCPCVLISLKVN